jgi:hypothetical protein
MMGPRERSVDGYGNLGTWLPAMEMVGSSVDAVASIGENMALLESLSFEKV